MLLTPDVDSVAVKCYSPSGDGNWTYVAERADSVDAASWTACGAAAGSTATCGGLTPNKVYAFRCKASSVLEGVRSATGTAKT